LTTKESTAFSAPGNWYRGNLHTHTTRSDGHKSPEECIAFYKEHGYDFLSITDHRLGPNITASEDILIIPGIETHCSDPVRRVSYHIVGIGLKQPFDEDLEATKGPAQDLVDMIRAHGGEAILAHPYWCGQSFDDTLAIKDILGVEIYNATCARIGKATSTVYWDWMLDRKHRGGEPAIWGLAVDDAHHYDIDACQGWIMVKAPELSVEAVMNAIRQGHFYSTQGPAIVDFRIDNDMVHVHTSPVKEIRLMSNRAKGKLFQAAPGELITSASCPVWKNHYIRVECVDENNRMAWSQALYIGE